MPTKLTIEIEQGCDAMSVLDILQKLIPGLSVVKNGRTAAVIIDNVEQTASDCQSPIGGQIQEADITVRYPADVSGLTNASVLRGIFVSYLKDKGAASVVEVVRWLLKERTDLLENVSGLSSRMRYRDKYELLRGQMRTALHPWIQAGKIVAINTGRPRVYKLADE